MAGYIPKESATSESQTRTLSPSQVLTGLIVLRKDER